MGSLNRFGRRHPRSSSHILSCTDCSSALRRERQYLERLRGAVIPEASQDLTARLLARTQQLAMAQEQPMVAGLHPARMLVFTAGGAAVAAGMVAVAAFAMAGEPVPVVAPFASLAVLQQSTQGTAVSRNLTGTQLTGLRTEGWACPELQAMGFHVISAQGTVVSGRPALKMRLSDGAHYATVLEQHLATRTPDNRSVADETAASEGSPVSPINVLTGHPAVDDGFVAAPAAAGALQDAPTADDGSLWIRTAAPWAAIYRASGTTFTYVSDLPPEQADDAVAVLVHAGATAGEGLFAASQSSAAGPQPVPPGNDSISERLQRGLRRIMELVTP
ncbi:anti-sigma factor [Micrococcaceae bacterium Sec5.7]